MNNYIKKAHYNTILQILHNRGILKQADMIGSIMPPSGPIGGMLAAIPTTEIKEDEQVDHSKEEAKLGKKLLNGTLKHIATKKEDETPSWIGGNTGLFSTDNLNAAYQHYNRLGNIYNLGVRANDIINNGYSIKQDPSLGINTNAINKGIQLLSDAETLGKGVSGITEYGKSIPLIGFTNDLLRKSTWGTEVAPALSTMNNVLKIGRIAAKLHDNDEIKYNDVGDAVNASLSIANMLGLVGSNYATGTTLASLGNPLVGPVLSTSLYIGNRLGEDSGANAANYDIVNQAVNSGFINNNAFDRARVGMASSLSNAYEHTVYSMGLGEPSMANQILESKDKLKQHFWRDQKAKANRDAILTAAKGQAVLEQMSFKQFSQLAIAGGAFGDPAAVVDILSDPNRINTARELEKKIYDAYYDMRLNQQYYLDQFNTALGKRQPNSMPPFWTDEQVQAMVHDYTKNRYYGSEEARKAEEQRIIDLNRPMVNMYREAWRSYLESIPECYKQAYINYRKRGGTIPIFEFLRKPQYCQQYLPKQPSLMDKIVTQNRYE